MQAKMILTLLIVALTSSVSWAMQISYSGTIRITQPVNPAARCLEGVDLTTCEQRRKFALNQGCISQAEYNTLKNFGAFPVCADYGRGLTLQSWCPCGCFHPDTLISTENVDTKSIGQTSAFDITNKKDDFMVVHLTPNSTISNFKLTSSPLRITTLGAEVKPLVLIETLDGRVIRVTEKHPVLTGAGLMVQAKDLKETDGLLDLNGSRIEIAAIRSEMFKGQVVNFMIEQPLTSKLEHVIFAHNIAVGDLGWQSSLEDELNQIIIRE